LTRITTGPSEVCVTNHDGVAGAFVEHQHLFI
jgi:hypothetical protein